LKLQNYWVFPRKRHPIIIFWHKSCNLSRYSLRIIKIIIYNQIDSKLCKIKNIKCYFSISFWKVRPQFYPLFSNIRFSIFGHVFFTSRIFSCLPLWIKKKIIIFRIIFFRFPQKQFPCLALWDILFSNRHQKALWPRYG